MRQRPVSTFDTKTNSDGEDVDADELLKRLGEGTHKRKRLPDDDHEQERYASCTSTSNTDSDSERSGEANASDDDQDKGYKSANDLSLAAERSIKKINLDDGQRITYTEGEGTAQSKLREKTPIVPMQTGGKRKAQFDFSDLGASKPLVASLAAMSIKIPTEVQIACVPPLLAGRDCVGNAKTGSGKTIAFALPILQKLAIDPYGVFALVLTPTRELAFQISEQFAALGAPLNIQTAVIVGGMDMISQAIELNNRPHVIVATPGRLVDHLKSSSGEWDLSRLKFLVLDEADRLLTTTFSSELSYLFNVLPKERQTCLFTATMTDSIESLISAPPRPGKEKPFVYRMTTSNGGISDVYRRVETVDTLRQHFVMVPSHVRESYLFYLLRYPPDCILHLRRPVPDTGKSRKPSLPKKSVRQKAADVDPDAFEQPPPTIIFCARTRTAALLTLLLQTLNIRATALHSRLTQRERLNALNLFRASVVPVLVTTDVGARGLDIDDVALVVNWDVPREPEEYTHRVGRTARRGRIGVAISFVTERDEESVIKIEERIHTKLEEMTMPEGKVLETLNAVSSAKRLANMELHDSDFGIREKIHKLKAAKRRHVGALRV